MSRGKFAVGDGRPPCHREPVRSLARRSGTLPPDPARPGGRALRGAPFRDCIRVRPRGRPHGAAPTNKNGSLAVVGATLVVARPARRGRCGHRPLQNRKERPAAGQGVLKWADYSSISMTTLFLRTDALQRNRLSDELLVDLDDHAFPSGGRPPGKPSVRGITRRSR